MRIPEGFATGKATQALDAIGYSSGECAGKLARQQVRHPIYTQSSRRFLHKYNQSQCR